MGEEVDPDVAIAAVAAEQHGVFSRKQALAAGFSSTTIYRRLETRRWRRPFESVYVVEGSPSSRDQELQLVRRWAPRGAFSHFTAAEVLRLDGVPRQPGVDLELFNAPRRPRAAPFEVRIHRGRGLIAKDVYVHDSGFRITRAARTIIDLAPLIDEDALERAILDAIRRKLVTAEYLQRRVAGRAQGTSCIETLRRLSAGNDHVAKLESTLEAHTLQLIRGAGLPDPGPQCTLTDARGFVGRFDFSYPGHNVLIECDGRSVHERNRTRDRDDERSNRAAALGQRLFRVTWTIVHEDPDRFLVPLATALGY